MLVVIKFQGKIIDSAWNISRYLYKSWTGISITEKTHLIRRPADGIFSRNSRAGNFQESYMVRNIHRKLYSARSSFRIWNYKKLMKKNCIRRRNILCKWISNGFRSAFKGYGNRPFVSWSKGNFKIPPGNQQGVCSKPVFSTGRNRKSWCTKIRSCRPAFFWNITWVRHTNPISFGAYLARNLLIRNIIIRRIKLLIINDSSNKAAVSNLIIRWWIFWVLRAGRRLSIFAWKKQKHAYEKK